MGVNIPRASFPDVIVPGLQYMSVQNLKNSKIKLKKIDGEKIFGPI